MAREADSMTTERAQRPLRLLGQQPALDGVRAVAVVAVMGFHAAIRQFHGGYLGVDVFFVLSGFLITSLLAAERDTSGRIDLGAFYMRRALRLLPALFVMVAVVSVVAALGPHIAESDTMARDAPATLFYYVNWVYAFLDHFEVRLLSHTWSLSIEEQFYLAWPLLFGLTALWARGRRTFIVALPIVLFFASNGLRWWLYNRGTSLPRLTYGTDVRAGAMMIGCAAGLLYTWDLLPRNAAGRMLVRVCGVIGVLGLVWMVFGERYGTLGIATHPARIYGEGYFLIATFAALIIVWLAMEPTSPLARLFSLRPMVWMGKVSYGLYLWHLPIDRFITNDRLNASTPVTQVVRLAMTLAVVTASFYLLEQPFLRLKRRFERRPDPASVAPLSAP